MSAIKYFPIEFNRNEYYLLSLLEMQQLTSNKFTLDISTSAFGTLRDSSDSLSDTQALQERMAADGYLYIRNLLDPELVIKARKEVFKDLVDQGIIFPSGNLYAPKCAQAKPLKKIDFNTNKFTAVEKLHCSDAVMNFYHTFLDGEVRKFDKFWVRAIGPKSKSETVHSDIVYMGKGTRNLYTSWTPLGNIPLNQGPLMILEKSHLLEDIKSYTDWDVDKNRNKLRYKHGVLFVGGHYSRNPPAVQKEFNRRWLSANFEMGDVLVFSAYTMHCALDNNTDIVRLSTDCRYQLASEPIDPRWVGEDPIGNKPLGWVSNIKPWLRQRLPM